MYRTVQWVARVGVLILLLAPASQASAQTLRTLFDFDWTHGRFPYGGLILSGSTLYGTASAGGANGDGTVFSLATSGGTPTTLLSLSGTNGAFLGSDPLGTLLLSGSTLYGTTYQGGPNNDGTVFSLATTGGALTTLCSFNGTNGSLPRVGNGLTLSGSTLYGTTAYGGTSSDGTVFSIATSGGTPTTLGNFNGTNGANPFGSLTLIGSTLYGMTSSFSSGVFSIATSGGAAPAMVAPFNTNANGTGPQGGGLALDGTTFYGMTDAFGPNGHGEVFRVAVTGGSPTTVYAFNGTDGNGARGGLTLSDSVLYGTTTTGGAYGHGNIFRVNTDGSGFNDLFDFNGTNGDFPAGTLLLSGSTLYGTTDLGGSGSGTVFALDLTPTPEPSTAILVGAGALAFTGYVWRRRRSGRRSIESETGSDKARIGSRIACPSCQYRPCPVFPSRSDAMMVAAGFNPPLRLHDHAFVA